MKATKRRVDAAIKKAGISAEVFQGNGYVYFDGDDIDYSRDVSAYGVFNIADLSVERWVEEVKEKCK